MKSPVNSTRPSSMHANTGLGADISGASTGQGKRTTRATPSESASPSATLVTDKSLIHAIIDRTDRRRFARGVGWMSLMPINMMSTLMVDILHRDVGDGTPEPLLMAFIFFGGIGLSALMGLQRNMAGLFLALFEKKITPRCPSCDAAWLDEASYQCACCEALHRAPTLAPWHDACAQCGIAPDAVVCWRCKQVSRLKFGNEVRALCMLRSPLEQTD